MPDKVVCAWARCACASRLEGPGEEGRRGRRGGGGGGGWAADLGATVDQACGPAPLLRRDPDRQEGVHHREGHLGGHRGAGSRGPGGKRGRGQRSGGAGGQRAEVQRDRIE